MSRKRCFNRAGPPLRPCRRMESRSKSRCPVPSKAQFPAVYRIKYATEEFRPRLQQTTATSETLQVRGFIRTASIKGLTTMVGIGIVGIGFMGMIHYLAAQKAQGLRVAALCSRDPKKLAGDWTSIQGNFGPRGTQMDLSGVALHRDYEALLADPRGRPGRSVRPQRRPWADGHPGTQGRQARAGRKTDRARDGRSRPDGRRRSIRRQVPHGRPRLTLFPRIRFCPRGGSVRALWTIARSPSDASDFQARLVQSESPIPSEAADRPSICTSTIRTLSGSSAVFRGRFTRAASSKTAPSSI